MSDHLFPDEGSLKRLRWLMFFRVIIVTFLLGIAAFVQIKGTTSLPTTSLYSIYYIIIITYFLSFIYALLLRYLKDSRINVYIQTLSDVILVTILVYVTGGIESIYSVFYPLIVIYSVLLLDKGGGFVIATVCSILYSGSLGLEYYGAIHPIYASSGSYSYSEGYVFSRIYIHIASFFIITFLTSFAVDREKKLRLLLAEKENAFHQLGLLHRSIIESVDTGILTFDLKGDVKSFNRAAEEMTGCAFHEIKDHSVENIFPGITALAAEVRDAARKKETRKRFEIVFDRGVGESKILGFAASGLMDGNGWRIGDIMVFQDLTALKEMEKEIERSKRLALIGEMAACFAHEMRNPLASLSGSVQMLRRDLRLSETDDRLMKIILRGKDQLENLLRDFLLLAKPRVDHREKTDVNELIDDVIESLRCSSEWSERIAVDCKLQGPGVVYGNRSEIRQALWNLALNAVQSMPEGGQLVIRTAVPSPRENEFLEIEVSDRGCGINEKDLAKIFEPFYTTKEKGSGLGLAIVSRIVESHGGKIRVENNPDRGARFILDLPRYAG